MKKDEYIAKYGEAAYEQLKLKSKKWYEDHKEPVKLLKNTWRQEHREQYNYQQIKWHQEHREQYNQISKNWYEKHREQRYQANKKHVEQHRIKGRTPYCTKNYDLIENYELAKMDNFDPKKWHLHHRLENYWSKSTLKRKGLYYDVNPEALIWLPSEEHMKDINCKDSKWHQRSLENG